jgi:hypothetical protein
MPVLLEPLTASVLNFRLHEPDSKLPSCLINQQAMNTHGGEADIASCILKNIGTRQRWDVRCIPQPLYHRYPLERKLLPQIEPGYLPSSLVTRMTELLRFPALQFWVAHSYLLQLTGPTEETVRWQRKASRLCQVTLGLEIQSCCYCVEWKS